MATPTTPLLALILLVPTLAAAQSTEGNPQGALETTNGAWIERAEPPFYLAVQVEEMERSIEWYSSTLGLRILDRARAGDDTWQISNLVSESLWVELIHDRRATSVDRARGFFKVGFRVPSVDGIAERIEQAGLEKPRVVEVARHQLRVLQLEDPDGNKLQLSSTLPTAGNSERQDR